MSSEICPSCQGTGWVLEGSPARHPLQFEILPCAGANCVDSGREVEGLSTKELHLASVAWHPSAGYVISLDRAG